MGFFYRKSIKLGPFRVNLSKSGIGVSAGVRGARVSTGPRGTYLNMGTGGFHKRQKIDTDYSTYYSSNDSPPLPSRMNYPVFPKHGPPRIVITMGLLSIPILIVSLWILAFYSAQNRSSATPVDLGNKARSGTSVATTNSSQMSRERGFQAGLSYARTEQNAMKSRNADPERITKLATQISADLNEDRNWTQGWIEGYKNGSESLNASRRKLTSRESSPTISPDTTRKPFLKSPGTVGKAFIRGPRGGCYYLSNSGRKVYVDRGLCN